MLNPESRRSRKGVSGRAGGWEHPQRGTGGGWCRRSGGLRRRCRCACRGGTRHPHRGPPAFPAAPARAPRPGRRPRPRGAAPWLARHVGAWWEARPCVPAWWCVVGSIPAPLRGWRPPGVWQGLRAELGLPEADHSGVGAGRGWVTLVLCPGLLRWGKALLVHSSCPKVGMFSPGRVCTNSLWNQKSLLLEVLSENGLSFFYF